MKLDVAADEVNVDARVDVVVAAGDSKTRKMRAGVAGIAFGLCTLFAGSAIALDGIDLSQPAEAPAAGECPKLIQIKYPFLSCANGQIGQSDEDETWDNSRRIPRGSIFVELDGYWGPDQGSGSDQYQ